MGDQEQREAARARAARAAGAAPACAPTRRAPRRARRTRAPAGSSASALGDRDALALAARELVRIAVPEALGGREAGVVERGRRRAARARRRCACPACAAAPARARSPRMRGLSDWYGSWKIICTLPPQRAHAVAVDAAAPSKRSSPALGCSRPSSVRASVDLPQPDSPTTPSTSFRRHSRSTPSSARTMRPRRPNAPRGRAPRPAASRRSRAASTLIGTPPPTGVCVSGANRQADSCSSPTSRSGISPLEQASRREVAARVEAAAGRRLGRDAGGDAGDRPAAASRSPPTCGKRAEQPLRVRVLRRRRSTVARRARSRRSARRT